jgi:hypothetical protein
MDDPILSDPPSFNLSLKKLALIVDPFSAESALDVERFPERNFQRDHCRF